MKTPTFRPPPRRPGFDRTADHPLRFRAELPALRGVWTQPLALPANAAHDFLVPNPRPDLTTDLHTLQMLEVA